jgi:hypothetical protein
MARAQPVEIGGVKFAKKGDALEHLRKILKRYSVGEHVSADDQAFLLEALKNHPDVDEKIGAGVDFICIQRADYNSRCFWIKRIDGSEVRFSYKSCV